MQDGPPRHGKDSSIRPQYRLDFGLAGWMQAWVVFVFLPNVGMIDEHPSIDMI